jgi:hypothetical protein
LQSFNAAISGAFAVIGTLTGAGVSYLFQRRAARRAEQTERAIWVWQHRIAVCSAFAGTLLSFRTAEHQLVRETLPRRRQRQNATRVEADRLRAASWEAYYQVLILFGIHPISNLALQAVEAAISIANAQDLADLNLRGARARDAVARFATQASAHVGDIDGS